LSLLRPRLEELHQLVRQRHGLQRGEVFPADVLVALGLELLDRVVEAVRDDGRDFAPPKQGDNVIIHQSGEQSEGWGGNVSGVNSLSETGPASPGGTPPADDFGTLTQNEVDEATAFVAARVTNLKAGDNQHTGLSEKVTSRSRRPGR
jgi:hypothetical protein